MPPSVQQWPMLAASACCPAIPLPAVLPMCALAIHVVTRPCPALHCTASPDALSKTGHCSQHVHHYSQPSLLQRTCRLLLSFMYQQSNMVCRNFEFQVPVGPLGPKSTWLLGAAPRCRLSHIPPDVQAPALAENMAQAQINCISPLKLHSANTPLLLSSKCITCLDGDATAAAC